MPSCAEPTAWHGLQAATRSIVPRVPFVVGGTVVGSVAATELDTLRGFAALAVDARGVELAVAAGERDAALAQINAGLRDAGRLRGWRDEIFPVYAPATLAPLAFFERAAARYWGTLTLGAHATGWVADRDGRPDAIWVAQRSFTKPTDPGLHDNLVGGGVPAGQTPDETLVREAWEEAGLEPAAVAGRRFAGILRTARDVPEGFQHEHIHCWDVELPASLWPRAVDGEVHAFRLLPMDEALALAASAEMTVDAALVTLDFGVRHGFVAAADVRRRLDALRVRAG